MGSDPNKVASPDQRPRAPSHPRARMDESDDSDEPSPLDGLYQSKPSGAQNRQAEKARTKGRLAPFDLALAAELQKIGPPPADPLDLALWHQRLAGFVSWAAATGNIGPGQAARLKIMLDGVNAGGRNVVKANDRKRQKKIAERLGLLEEADDGLDEYPAVVGQARRAQ
jgi:hypothetical protein